MKSENVKSAITPGSLNSPLIFMDPVAVPDSKASGQKLLINETSAFVNSTIMSIF